MYAGLASLYFPLARINDAYQYIREGVIPMHEELRSQGLQGAFFLVNPDTGHGVGVSFWETAEKLVEIEGATTREMAREMRDVKVAPTEYTRARAKAVESAGGTIAHADWYEVVGHVPVLTVPEPKVQVRMPKWRGA